MADHMTELQVGDIAPDFDLPIVGQERVKLADALKRGPLVLLAYVFDFTGGWTTELSEFGKKMDDFAQRGAQVFGISVDSPFSHGVYRTQLNLPDSLTLLSDFNRDFGRAYGILNTTPGGLKDVLRRTVFIVGRDGRITYRWDNTTPPSLPKPDEVLSALDRAGS